MNSYQHKRIAPQELERRLLHGLRAEWEKAALQLKNAHGYALSAPSFELRDMESILGEWFNADKRIAISRAFALTHPWMSVRDVLLHEIAHQLARECLGQDPTAHGPNFHRACGFVGASPAASGRYAEFGERSDGEKATENEDDKILQKVQKLLALANSNNENEAEVAMKKAHEFIARYNVDLLAVDKERNYTSAFIGEPALRHSRDQYALGALLRQFYFVLTVWASAYVLRRGKMGRILDVVGTEANVKMAKYVHAFLTRTIKAQWLIFSTGKHLTEHQRCDFATGLVHGFQDKLLAQQQEWNTTMPPLKAIIQRRDARLDAHLRERYPRLCNRGGSSRVIDNGVYGAGTEAGRNTVLSKPIEHGRASRGLALME